MLEIHYYATGKPKKEWHACGILMEWKQAGDNKPLKKSKNGMLIAHLICKPSLCFNGWLEKRPK